MTTLEPKSRCSHESPRLSVSPTNYLHVHAQPLIVSHFARVWRDCQPTNRHTLAIRAVAAMGVDAGSDIDAQFGLTALLSRGKEKFTATLAHVTHSRNLMMAVLDVVQFVNGIHHVDEFPQFPDVLTNNFAKDLSASCRTAASVLGRLR
jgi:hypothetical protein